MEQLNEWGNRLEAWADWAFSDPIRMGIFTAILLSPVLIVLLRAHKRARREAQEAREAREQQREERHQSTRLALGAVLLMAGAIVGLGWYLANG